MKYQLFIKFLIVSCLAYKTCLTSTESPENDKEDNDGIVSLAASSSHSANSMSPNKLTEFNHWAEYHKQTSRLDSILSKCYDCIRDRSNGENREGRDDKDNPIHSKTALKKFDFPPFNIIDKVAFWFSGPVINSHGKFVSAGIQHDRERQVNTYKSASYNKRSSSFAKSATCIVGLLGYDAYVTACEYGNSYCQIESVTGLYYGRCVSICAPIYSFIFNVLSICSTGAISNKLAPICLVGDLSSTSFGAVPVVCEPGEQCEIDLTTQTGSCSFFCVIDSDTSCSSADYGGDQHRGPLCYVGIFGQSVENTGAVLLGCGIGASCVLSTEDGIVSGSCAETCTESSTIKCFTSDFGNKQGPVCFVGEFGGEAVPVACLKGQQCQRSVIITPLGTTLSTGSCVTVCGTGANNYCCSSDLCNAYESTINQKECYNDSHSEKGNIYGGSSYPRTH